MNETEINEALQAWADSWLGDVQVVGPNRRPHTQLDQSISLAGRSGSSVLSDEWGCIGDEFVFYLRTTFGLRYAKSGYDRFPDAIHLRQL